MKMISNFTDLNIHVTTDEENGGLQSLYAQIDLNNDTHEELNSAQLLSYINAQFNMLYKENQKRRYLVKEISSYLVQK